MSNVIKNLYTDLPAALIAFFGRCNGVIRIENEPYTIFINQSTPEQISTMFETMDFPVQYIAQKGFIIDENAQNIDILDNSDNSGIYNCLQCGVLRSIDDTPVLNGSISICDNSILINKQSYNCPWNMSRLIASLVMSENGVTFSSAEFKTIFNIAQVSKGFQTCLKTTKFCLVTEKEYGPILKTINANIKYLADIEDGNVNMRVAENAIMNSSIWRIPCYDGTFLPITTYKNEFVDQQKVFCIHLKLVQAGKLDAIYKVHVAKPPRKIKGVNNLKNLTLLEIKNTDQLLEEKNETIFVGNFQNNDVTYIGEQ